MSYTATQIKDLTSVSAVAGWSDDKILLIQTSAESILAGLDADSSISGYTEAFNASVIHIFDWIADNPTMLKSTGRGKVSKVFMESLPLPVQLIMKKYVDGSTGNLAPSKLARKDIGLR